MSGNESPSPSLRLLDDLLGVILLAATVVFIGTIELTRRKVCKLYQFTFGLSATYAIFVGGGLIDRYTVDEQLALALYTAYIPPAVPFHPVLLSIVSMVPAAITARSCSCPCCADNKSKRPHKDCFVRRVKDCFPLYLSLAIFLMVVIGMRLNARLRQSAVEPVNGTVHWLMFKSPFYLTIAHVGSVLLVALKLILQRAGHHCPNDSSGSSAEESRAFESSDNYTDSGQDLEEKMLNQQAQSASLRRRNRPRSRPISEIAHEHTVRNTTTGLRKSGDEVPEEDDDVLSSLASSYVPLDKVNKKLELPNQASNYRQNMIKSNFSKGVQRASSNQAPSPPRVFSGMWSENEDESASITSSGTGAGYQSDSTFALGYSNALRRRYGRQISSGRYNQNPYTGGPRPPQDGLRKEASEWVEYFDNQSGRNYLYNHRTAESKWAS